MLTPLDIPDAQLGQPWLPLVTKHLQQATKPLIVIVGPTASGKTAFSCEVCTYVSTALQRSSEIVNADSRQLYKYLDIGTGKISKKDRGTIPHHLLDVLDPKEEVTAAWYRDRAMETIDDIHKRGCIPILVGGSMLYMSAIIDGLQFVEARDEQLREQLSDEYDRDGGVALHQRLATMDPESSKNIPLQNKPYIIRALEINLLSGSLASTAQTKNECPYDLLILGLTVERSLLHKRIEARVTKMFDDGWVAEVQGLIDKGYVHTDPGMKSVGYDLIAQALLAGTIDEKALQKKIMEKTRQYAKRQMTWWRGDERILWF